MKYISHRGDLANAVENTIEAFTSALSSSVDMIEMDIRRAKDGVWVVYHDQTLTRLHQQEVWTKELDSFKLQALGISTLQHVLDKLNGKVALYLDIKEPHSDNMVKSLWRLIHKNLFPSTTNTNTNNWKPEQFYFASFNGQTVKSLLELKKQSQQSQKQQSQKQGQTFNVGLITDNDLSVLRIPAKLDFISFNSDVCDKKCIAAIRQKYPKLQIYVYLFNDLISLQKYKNLKVDGLLTDYPHLFSKLRKSN